MNSESGLVVQRLPTEREWEDIKPIIRRLYLEEERNLPDVMGIMKNTCGFKATCVFCSLILTSVDLLQHSDVQEEDHEVEASQV